MKTIHLLIFLILIFSASCSPSQLAPLPSTSTVRIPDQAPATSTNTPISAASPSPVQLSSPTHEQNEATQTPTFETPASATPDLSSSPASVRIDHTSVALFEAIPDEAIQAASQLRFMLRHASIGANIDFGLNCLWGNFPDRRPAACGDFFDPKYDRSQWSFQARGNPGWIEKVDDFVIQVDQQAAEYDILAFTLAYADGLDEGNYPKISDLENFQKLYIDKLEALELAHPDKTFVWVTMALARVGFENEQLFNTMLRDYTAQHNKILFDLADIEAHDPDGNYKTNDLGIEVLYEQYTDEVKSGHLNEHGRERTARAFWVLMARLAGWDGS